MRAKAIILLGILFAVSLSFGQKQGNIWYFGEGAGLDFNSGTPVVLTDGQIYGNPLTSDEFQYNEGCATISDSTGSMLFYSNGDNIWNSKHEVMPNGDSLMGMYSSTHAAFIVPQPLSDSLFYVFTTDGLERNLRNGLRYSMVNMCLANGLGDVIENKKNILLLDTVSEKLAAINHQNGKDIWLIAHKFGSDAFYAYQISEDGIVDTVITNIGSVHAGNGAYSAIGQMKPSPDGNRIALVFSNVIPAVAEVFDFDNSTGVLSNHINLTTSGNEYGIEFSPDNSKLYITSLSGLHQFDLLAGGGTELAINASRTNIPMPFSCIPAGMQLGPDDKIYVNRCGASIAVINSPNASGVACNFVDNVISFGPVFARVTFPSFINGFEYRNGTYDCTVSTTTGLDNGGNSFAYKVYPNPASQTVVLEYGDLDLQDLTITVHDYQGRAVRMISIVPSDKQVIDVSDLPQGLYILQMSSSSEVIISEKLVVR